LDIWIRPNIDKQIALIYKSRNWIYGLDNRGKKKNREIYKSRNWIYGLDLLLPPPVLGISTKVEIGYMD